MDDMDKFTLECFVNKQTYKKYLAKHDPGLFEETQGLYDKIQLHQTNIMHITEQMLLEPDSETYNKTLRDSFESYMKSLLYHLEVECSATKQITRSEEIYDENEPDEMLIDVPLDEPASTTNNVANHFSFLSQKPENPIEYWKKYAVKKKG